MKIYRLVTSRRNCIFMHPGENTVKTMQSMLKMKTSIKELEVDKYWFVMFQKYSGYRHEDAKLVAVYLDYPSAFTLAQTMFQGCGDRYDSPKVILGVRGEDGNVSVIMDKRYTNEEKVKLMCIEQGVTSCDALTYSHHKVRIFGCKDHGKTVISDRKEFVKAEDAYKCCCDYLDLASDEESTYCFEWKAFHGLDGVDNEIKARVIDEWFGPHYSRTKEYVRKMVDDMYEKEQKPYETDMQTLRLAVNNKGEILYEIDADAPDDCHGMYRFNQLIKNGCHEELFTGVGLFEVKVQEDHEDWYKNHTVGESEPVHYKRYFRSHDAALEKCLELCKNEEYIENHSIEINCYRNSESYAAVSVHPKWFYAKYGIDSRHWWGKGRYQNDPLYARDVEINGLKEDLKRQIDNF